MANLNNNNNNNNNDDNNIIKNIRSKGALQLSMIYVMYYGKIIIAFKISISKWYTHTETKENDWVYDYATTLDCSNDFSSAASPSFQLALLRYTMIWTMIYKQQEKCKIYKLHFVTSSVTNSKPDIVSCLSLIDPLPNKMKKSS